MFAVGYMVVWSGVLMWWKGQYKCVFVLDAKIFSVFNIISKWITRTQWPFNDQCVMIYYHNIDGKILWSLNIMLHQNYYIKKSVSANIRKVLLI